jgi:histidinol phosphatase-like PHP family hydrolase
MSTEWVGVGTELARSLDLVLVPTSHYHLPGVPQPPGDGPAAMADHMLDMLQAVVLKPWVDAVAHPLADSEAVIGDLRRIYEAMDPARLHDVLGLAAENGVALEVNAGALLSPELPHYGEVYREVARQARAQGVRFTFGSDAHDYRKLGLSPDVEEWIVATGLNRDDFLTPADIAARRAG